MKGKASGGARAHFLLVLGVLFALSTCAPLPDRRPDFPDGGMAEPAPPYDRDEFGGWSDEDGDCMNTRHEVLAALSSTSVTLSSDGCRVVRGRWPDPYTSRIFSEATDLDVDHLVSLDGLGGTAPGAGVMIGAASSRTIRETCSPCRRPRTVRRAQMDPRRGYRRTRPFIANTSCDSRGFRSTTTSVCRRQKPSG